MDVINRMSQRDIAKRIGADSKLMEQSMHRGRLVDGIATPLNVALMLARIFA
jgi:hypothetical protein